MPSSACHFLSVGIWANLSLACLAIFMLCALYLFYGVQHLIIGASTCGAFLVVTVINEIRVSSVYYDMVISSAARSVRYTAESLPPLEPAVSAHRSRPSRSAVAPESPAALIDTYPRVVQV